MPKAMRFVVGRTVVCERRLSERILAWKIQRVWGQEGDSSELSREFFETLKVAKIGKEIFDFQEEKVLVPRAKEGSGEWLGRRIIGQPTTAYSYIDYYVTISLAGGFVYRVEEEKLYFHSLKELIVGEVSITSLSNENGGRIVVGPPEALERGWQYSSHYIEVIRSPLQQKFKRRKAYK